MIQQKMLDKFKKYDIVLTANLNTDPKTRKWIPRIFLEYDNYKVTFTDLDIPKDYIVVKEFDEKLAYTDYKEERIPKLPNKGDIVYASLCDYAFNPNSNLSNWFVRKFVRIDGNKFITETNDGTEQRWDYLIEFFDNRKPSMDLNNVLTMTDGKLSYVTSFNMDE